MIWGPDGQEYGTDREVADRLTKRDASGAVLELVTPAMVRRWHDRRDLPKVRMRGPDGRWQVVYPVVEAARHCRHTADTSRGRPRQLDMVGATA